MLVDYTYNEVNSRRGTFTVKDGADATLYSDSYTYNPNLGYLTGATYTGANAPPTGSWFYDASGNRSNSGYAYDQLNRMTASPGLTYAHDKVGNRTAQISEGGWRTHSWDALNRMTGMEAYLDGGPSGPYAAAAYRYRADGLRTEKLLSDENSTPIEEEELSSFYDFNTAINNRSWFYYYDGQMSILELYTGATHEGQVLVDATRNYLGARGGRGAGAAPVPLVSESSLSTFSWPN